jgi:hypothetical protein
MLQKLLKCRSQDKVSAKKSGFAFKTNPLSAIAKSKTFISGKG